MLLVYIVKSRSFADRAEVVITAIRSAVMCSNIYFDQIIGSR